MSFVALFFALAVAGIGLAAAGLGVWFFGFARQRADQARVPLVPSRVARVLLCVLGTLACLAGAPLLWLAWQRSLLPYNELGRYYDGGQGIVYVDNAVPVYIVIGGCLLAFGLANLALVWFRRSAC